MAKTVRDVMAPGPPTIDADVSIEDAARLMRRWDMREVFVTDRGRFCGVLAYRDIVVLAISSDHPPASTSAGQACDPVTPRLDADQPTATALDHMRRHDHRHLPVVDDGRLVGTVWIDDLLAAKAAKAVTSAVTAPRILSVVDAPQLSHQQRCHRRANPAGRPARPPLGT